MASPQMLVSPPEPEPLIDYPLVASLVGYALRSVRRHKWMCAGVFVATMAVTAGIVAVLPRTYYVDTRILVQRNQVMAALGNPNRAIPWEADTPTRAASETVLRRDNLVSLVKETGLIDHWESTRPRLNRWKDAVMARLKGAPTDEDKLQALVGMLERRLMVTTNDEGMVIIGVDWPDASMAYRLVQTAQENFLEARHAAESSGIADAISILERYAANLHSAIDATVKEMKSQPGTAPAQHAAAPRRAVAEVFREATQAAVAVDPELAQLKAQLSSKQQAVNDYEEFRQRRVLDLQAQLTQWRTMYSEAHPSLVNLRQSIEALSRDSPQLAALRRERDDLEAAYREKSQRSAPVRKPVVGDSVPAPKAPERSETVTEEDFLSDLSTARLRFELANLRTVLERIDSARIELDTARAAFKYRYNVIRPAELPKTPARPNVFALLEAGAVVGLLLALFAAVLADVRRGRILERWQVERLVGLKVLATVRS
jgi:uncharacterized protein involved in exopolysaccharide biosynthesis